MWLRGHRGDPKLLTKWDDLPSRKPPWVLSINFFLGDQPSRLANLTLLFCVFRADCFKLGVTRCAGLLYHKQLVGGNSKMFYFFNPTWGNDPIWLIFFRWVGSTTNHTSTLGFSASYLPNPSRFVVSSSLPCRPCQLRQTFARTKFGEDLPFACISAHPQEPRGVLRAKQIRRIK